MAESGTLTFNDPGDCASRFGDARVKFTVTGPGQPGARLTWLKLRDLELYRCSESAPRVAYLSLPTDRIFISFLIRRSFVVCDGSRVRNGDFVFHSPDGHAHQRMTGASQWGLISLSAAQFAAITKAIIGRAIAAPFAGEIVRPTYAETRQFKLLVAQACHLAESRRNLVDHPEVARALKHDLLHALTACLTSNDADRHNCMTSRHRGIMIRFEEILDKRLYDRLSVPALCAEIGVPERTLRLICADFLGVPPMRYVLLKRLNEVRSALRRANPDTNSVTDIARNHQFLQLGRFSDTYRSIFGELPSATLQRDPET
jgi:AraC-like DNA-binding protein